MLTEGGVEWWGEVGDCILLNMNTAPLIQVNKTFSSKKVVVDVV